MTNKFLFSAGQRRIYKEGEKPVSFPRTPFEPAKIITDIKPLELHPKFQKYNYVVNTDVTEFIEGVSAEMLDWWLANMEKGYYLWAPGEHYGFAWEKAPCETGYEGSVEAVYEFDPVHPMYMKRISIREYPFTECYEHCWMGFSVLGVMESYLVHMYENVAGGVYWRTVHFMTQHNYEIMKLHEKELPDLSSHNAYESGRLKDFLPALYNLWKDHPDPWQNMHYDLTVQKNEDGSWSHKYLNLPPKKE